MRHSLFTASLIGAFALGAVTLGRDTPLRLAENAPGSTSDEASIHAYGDNDKTCLQWTDGCRTCGRPENGEAFCSNIGPACQPVAISCARRVEPPKTETPK
jgi:hypothetical protein